MIRSNIRDVLLGVFDGKLQTSLIQNNHSLLFMTFIDLLLFFYFKSAFNVNISWSSVSYVWSVIIIINNKWMLSENMCVVNCDSVLLYLSFPGSLILFNNSLF